MDRRHLSIERTPPPGHLANRRFGVGHGSTGSKAPSPAPFAGTARKNVRAVASLACRRHPPLLASLLQQARPSPFGDFALAGWSDVSLRNVTNAVATFTTRVSPAYRRHAPSPAPLLGS